jgi:thiamine-phosphate pyrophosphorylase
VRSPDFDLYLVTDRHQTNGRDLLSVVEQALEGGVKAVQLREKDLNGRELFALAEKTRRLCLDYGATLFINDRIDVALAVDADGVQLGSASVPLDAARQLLGGTGLIGASTHSLQEAQDAERYGADFVLFGPVFFTPSKAAYGAPQGTGALREIVEKISLPIYAIGGVTADNVAETTKTGVCGIAVISAIMSAEDPRDAAVKLLSRLHR